MPALRQSHTTPSQLTIRAETLFYSVPPLLSGVGLGSRSGKKVERRRRCCCSASGALESKAVYKSSTRAGHAGAAFQPATLSIVIIIIYCDHAALREREQNALLLNTETQKVGLAS